MRLPWYNALEAQINRVAWLPYAVATIVILVTATLLVLALTGHPVKTVLVAWLVYLVSP